MTPDPVLATVLEALDGAKIGAHGYRVRDGVLERIFINRIGASRLGYTVDELFALPWIETIAPKQRPLILELLGRVSGGEGVAPAIEVELLHRDGHIVRSEVRTTQLALPDGNILVSLFRDVGSQAPRSILETDRLAVVGALAAGIAHEINNPLTYVLLHLRSLRRAIEEWGTGHVSDAARRIDEAYAGAERIRAIVRAVMTFAATPGEAIDVDLGTVVQSALRLARPELESRGRIVCQMFPVAPVRADEPRLGQAVLSMLLFASAGFPGDDPTLNRIVVALEMRDGQVVLEVADNGRDLSPDELARVHDLAFFRGHGDGAGPAYGLGMARSIAMGASGGLTITRRPGGGVVATLTLPAVAVATEPQQG